MLDRLARRSRRTAGPMLPDTHRVSFLMYDATGSGGVARSVIMLAGCLAQTHDVRILSLLRSSEELRYPVDARIELTWLLDNRRNGGRRGRPRDDRYARGRRRRLDAEPSELESDPGISAYTDFLLQRELPRLAPGVLVTTRPMLHQAAARWAPGHVLQIAQDHLNFEVRMRNREVTSLLDGSVPTADAFVTLTEADRRDYQRRYPGVLVERIPNASPFPVRTGEVGAQKIVVGAGRLVRRKGFDRLVAAWAPLAREFPDWQLHIYGEGRCRAALERQISSLGIRGSVRLPGYASDFDEVLSTAALFAMPSRFEGFPMVLLEAMSHGLPLVSFDCPRGPAEIIEDGVTGRLVADDDVDGYTRALRDVMSDEHQRRQMCAAARKCAAEYQIETISARWEALFRKVLDRRTTMIPAGTPS